MGIACYVLYRVKCRPHERCTLKLVPYESVISILDSASATLTSSESEGEAVTSTRSPLLSELALGKLDTTRHYGTLFIVKFAT